MNKNCSDCGHWLSQFKTLDNVVMGICGAQTTTKNDPVYKSEYHWCSGHKEAEDNRI